MTKSKRIKILRKKVKKSKKIISGLQDVIDKLDKKVRSVEKHMSIGQLKITIHEFLNKIPGRCSTYMADLYFIFNGERINKYGIKFSEPWVCAHTKLFNNPLHLYLNGHLIARSLNAKFTDDGYIVHNRAGEMKCL